jgi:archaeal type IV pilus assembly protein PilA
MDESAVSESVGVILIVAVTVILAALIAAMALGLTGGLVNTNYNIILTTQHTNTTHVAVSYNGGSDSGRLSSLTITWPSGFQDVITTPRAGEMYSDPGLIPASSPHNLVIVGHFTDNKDQVLLNTIV